MLIYIAFVEFPVKVVKILDVAFNPGTESTVILLPLKVAVPKYIPNEFNAVGPDSTTKLEPSPTIIFPSVTAKAETSAN